jgi:hypothetical protein
MLNKSYKKKSEEAGNGNGEDFFVTLNHDFSFYKITKKAFILFYFISFLKKYLPFNKKELTIRRRVRVHLGNFKEEEEEEAKSLACFC